VTLPGLHTISFARRAPDMGWGCGLQSEVRTAGPTRHLTGGAGAQSPKVSRAQKCDDLLTLLAVCVRLLQVAKKAERWFTANADRQFRVARGHSVRVSREVGAGSCMIWKWHMICAASCLGSHMLR